MMTRRGFGLTLAGAARAIASGGRRVAVTVDDLPAARVSFTPDQLRSFPDFLKLSRRFLKACKKRRAPLTGFVTEGFSPQLWAPSDLEVLLEDWLDSGAELGNHTYSHPDLNKVSMERFQADVVLGSSAIDSVGARRDRKVRFFRHPYLHTGSDRATRHEIGQFLNRRGYRVAPVTIDTQDWLFAEVYSWAWSRRNQANCEAIRRAYLSYLGALVDHTQAISAEALGREPPQVLLLHANALNFDSIEQVLDVFVSRGYSFESIEDALKDPAYEEDVPALGSWVHGWREVRELEEKPDPSPEEFLGLLLEDYLLVRGHHPEKAMEPTKRLADAQHDQ